jgi:hypothetical protein
VKSSIAPALLAAALPALLAAAAPGRAGERTGGFSFGASFRTVASVADNFDAPLIFGEGNDRDASLSGILRLTADGRGGAGTFEVHLVQDVTASSSPLSDGAARGIVSGGAARYRALDLSRETLKGNDVRGNLFLDRLNARWRAGAADITLGRQAVSFSQAYFWNPLDIFLAFDPEAFDRSYKPGVDAVRADLALGAFSSVTLVAAAGNTFQIVPAAGGFTVEETEFQDEPWEGSALVARGRTTLRHWDVTLQGGKVSGGWQVGGGFSGEAGTLGLRGEATWLFADGGDTVLVPGGDVEPVAEDHGKAVVGADHLFASSLYVNVEYFFNGAGEDGDLAAAIPAVLTGETPNLGRHYLGAQVSYDLHPLLAGQVAWIHSLTDGSDLVTPTLRWSMADEAECVFGAILGFGDRPVAEGGVLSLTSEFGASPNLYFTELIFYF